MAPPVQVLVDGFVDELVEQVVKRGAVAHVADVHPRPAAHRLQPLQHLDVVGGVVLTVAGPAFCRARRCGLPRRLGEQVG